MSEKTVPVVVTLSGSFEIGVDEAGSVGDLVALAISKWNIDESEIEQCFVVRSDVNNGGHETVSTEQLVKDLARENGMFRVVLPLKPKA